MWTKRSIIHMYMSASNFITSNFCFVDWNSIKQKKGSDYIVLYAHNLISHLSTCYTAFSSTDTIKRPWATNMTSTTNILYLKSISFSENVLTSLQFLIHSIQKYLFLSCRPSLIHHLKRNMAMCTTLYKN